MRTIEQLEQRPCCLIHLSGLRPCITLTAISITRTVIKITQVLVEVLAAAVLTTTLTQLMV